MLLFSVPVTLLGMASPFAVRLGVRSVEEAGGWPAACTRSRPSGSILGTFLPVALLIPRIGTRRTMLAIGRPARAGRRAGAGPPLHAGAGAIAAVALVPPGRDQAGSRDLFEGESAYQFVQVQKLPGGGRRCT